MADLTTTTQLLASLADGDTQAREILLRRHLPRLRNWARGRLPQYNRDLSETDDLVQVTLLRALNNLETFEARRPGAFLAYLRTILINAVRDEVRRNMRRPEQSGLREDEVGSPVSLVEQMVGQESLQAYERALSRLDEDKRVAVIMRVEFGMSYQEIALELARPSAGAVRMMINRALEEIARRMDPERAAR